MDGNPELQELQRLADDPELVVSVELSGQMFRAFIGDRQHGYRASSRRATLASAVEWLQRQARLCYPESRYVQQRPARVPSIH